MLAVVTGAAAAAGTAQAQAQAQTQHTPVDTHAEAAADTRLDSAGLDTSTTPPARVQLSERVAAVRAAWAAGLAADPLAGGPTQQAANWTNWPKWSKWSNWANK